MAISLIGAIGAAVLGVFIGLLAGLIGVGGGTVMVPMYRLVFGMSAIASTATSLFTIIPTSISGLISHLRNKTCIPKLGIALGIGGACTSPLGVWLANMSPSWLVMLAAALVIGYSSFTMAKKALAAPKTGESAPAQAKQGPTEDSPAAAPKPSRELFAKGVLIGLFTGVASGYVGLGGGFIMVPLMLAWLNIPMKQASGTSLLAIMILAIPGAVAQGLLGNIDYLVGIVTAVGTIPGAFAGARLVTRVPERTLRLIFAAFLAVGAVLLVVREFVLFV